MECENIETSTDMSARAVYYAPEWLERPELKADSNTFRVLEALRQRKEGASIAQVANELGLTRVQVKHAIAGLQAGRRASVLVFRRNEEKNIEFAADRILHHLRWDDQSRADLTLNWAVEQYGDPMSAGGYATRIAERMLHVIQSENFDILGVSFSKEKKEEIAQNVALWLGRLARQLELNASIWNDGVRVKARSGAAVLNLDEARNRKAQELMEGSEEERMRGRLMVLCGLRKK